MEPVTCCVVNGEPRPQNSNGSLIQIESSNRRCLHCVSNESFNLLTSERGHQHIRQIKQLSPNPKSCRNSSKLVQTLQLSPNTGPTPVFWSSRSFRVWKVQGFRAAIVFRMHVGSAKLHSAPIAGARILVPLPTPSIGVQRRRGIHPSSARRASCWLWNPCLFPASTARQESTARFGNWNFGISEQISLEKLHFGGGPHEEKSWSKL